MGVLQKMGVAVRYLGYATIGLGLLAMLAPVLSGASVVVLVGLVLLVAGLVRGMFGWRAWSAGRGPLGLVTGGLTAACGLMLVANPVATLSTVVLVLAVYFVLDGVAEAIGSMQMIGDEGWLWMLGAGLLSVLLGISMWAGWPVSGERAIGVLVGIRLISAGVAMLRVERAVSRVDAGVRAVGSRLRSE